MKPIGYAQEIDIGSLGQPEQVLMGYWDADDILPYCHVKALPGSFMKEIVSTLTSNGQVTLPAAIRRHLRVGQGDKLSLPEIMPDYPGR